MDSVTTTTRTRQQHLLRLTAQRVITLLDTKLDTFWEQLIMLKTLTERTLTMATVIGSGHGHQIAQGDTEQSWGRFAQCYDCLLYTSDAADE